MLLSYLVLYLSIYGNFVHAYIVGYIVVLAFLDYYQLVVDSLSGTTVFILRFYLSWSAISRNSSW